jgi:hypothetical protein
MAGPTYTDGDDSAGHLAPSNEGGAKAGRPAIGMPTSAPSTYVGVFVLVSVAGLALIRHSFRRFM